MTYGIGYPCPGLEQPPKCAGVKPVNGNILPSDNWISIDNANINKL